MNSSNTNTLVAVSGYAGDVHQIEQNLAVYLHHGCPVVIFSPGDAPITKVSAPGVHCQWVGQKGWIGPHTLERQRLYLELLLKFPQDWFLFNDSDSVCLSPKIPDYLYRSADILYSNEVPDTNPGPSMLPKVALQPPYFFHRRALEKLLVGAKNPATSFYGPPVNPDGWPMPFPTECVDNYMLCIAHSGGLPHDSFRDGVSFETGSQLGLDMMSGQVSRHGKVFLHSIKTKTAIDRVVHEYARRMK